MKKAYFISDLHLGAPYFQDSRESESRVVRFLDSIRDSVSELYLVGDILDYWYEYKYVVPKGFVRFFGKLAEMADSGVKITWLIGNHDIWMFGYLRDELGIEIVDGTLRREIFGHHFEIAHGDGIGGTRKFMFMRALFRNRFCQRLYSGINPRWTIPFAQRWSRSSRENGKEVSCVASELLKKMRIYCKEEKKRYPDIDYFIFGHLHLVCDEPVEGDAKLIVLGDWISNFTYGVYDGSTFEIVKYT